MEIDCGDLGLSADGIRLSQALIGVLYCFIVELLRVYNCEFVIILWGWF